MTEVKTSSCVKVVLKNEINFDEWKHFVNDCPSATIYHLPEWSKIIEESFGYESFHIFAKNEHGNINFVLLNAIGKPKINCLVNNEFIINSLKYYSS